ncbi:hypothetical protein [Hydrogenophaga sp.]|uniref:hypothetical protein n=1 Tax=Hydrogenophaga sp. TaxID=1904254 RepID=UPI002608F266|nr:hypothetical protein [Hydrogenophaga sp.]MDM7950662.1 hypothetical protein [Hydrogenophaga sp.]
MKLFTLTVLVLCITTSAAQETNLTDAHSLEEYLRLADRTPIKPSPPPEYGAARPVDRLMRPWAQRLSAVPQNEDYRNWEWFDFDFGPGLSFSAWSSNFHCFQTGYDVEVVKFGSPFSGIPNFSSAIAARCGINQECTVNHIATPVSGSQFRVVPGGFYRWRGRIAVVQWGLVEVPSGNCPNPRPRGAYEWFTPTIQPKPPEGSDLRDSFGFKEQWLPVIATAGDIFVEGGRQEQEDWPEATRQNDGRFVSIVSNETGNGRFSVGVPIRIENVNYVRNGVIRFAARAPQRCEHILTLVLTDYKNQVLRRQQIDRRILNGSLTAVEIQIIRSSLDLRSWIKQGEGQIGMSGILAVLAECRSLGAGNIARVEYDQLSLAMEAQTFFKRTDW